MDVVLGFADTYFFTPFVYPAAIPETNPWRQFLSLNVLTDVGGALLYLTLGTFSYVFIFDKDLLKHPQILKASEFRFRVFGFWSVVRVRFSAYRHSPKTADAVSNYRNIVTWAHEQSIYHRLQVTLTC